MLSVKVAMCKMRLNMYRRKIRCVTFFIFNALFVCHYQSICKKNYLSRLKNFFYEKNTVVQLG